MEHRSYDPFGKPRYGTMQASSTATLLTIASGTPFTQRGFTDHEHIDEAQLIHMNGRVYDYNLGRFLSVDPFVQSPGNSQSMNPYSYIMNNPLAGTDPSGYKWETIWDRETGTLEELEQVLTKLGFEVSNGYVNLNHPKAIKGQEAEKLMSKLEDDGYIKKRRGGSSSKSSSGGTLYKVVKVKGKWQIAGEVDSVTTAHAAVNGILNEADRAAGLMGDHLEHAYEDDEITEYTLYHNPTEGVFWDSWETFRDKMGWTTDVAKGLARVLDDTQKAGIRVKWVAHSQGGAIFAEAVRYLGKDLSNTTVAFHASASNTWMTKRIMASSNVSIRGFLNHPGDAVPNIIGLNTANPFKIIRSIWNAPSLVGSENDPYWSPHTMPCQMCEYTH
ncbi:RHS repeat domain-containing protein [Pseudidiomarina woesei]|uniref:RHS repeat-associated core domain n=1 Tax=Pseudidiomarina woesei TaxID=1381080 RepID=A0A0K6H3P5_9GAMM|nr:RHS repeat-associated core domain-containing protein [Pseudidiomarina woesei]CUA85364.1 RHS repeat-associated core domain [Pseudidiomarina woesei]